MPAARCSRLNPLRIHAAWQARTAAVIIELVAQDKVVDEMWTAERVRLGDQRVVVVVQGAVSIGKQVLVVEARLADMYSSEK